MAFSGIIHVLHRCMLWLNIPSFCSIMFTIMREPYQFHIDRRWPWVFWAYWTETSSLHRGHLWTPYSSFIERKDRGRKGRVRRERNKGERGQLLCHLLLSPIGVWLWGDSPHPWPCQRGLHPSDWPLSTTMVIPEGLWKDHKCSVDGCLPGADLLGAGVAAEPLEGSRGYWRRLWTPSRGWWPPASRGRDPRHRVLIGPARLGDPEMDGFTGSANWRASWKIPWPQSGILGGPAGVGRPGERL